MVSSGEQLASAVAPDPNDSSKNTLKIENTEKRDTLIASEKKYQKAWADSKIFEATAPTLNEVPFGSVSPSQLRDQQPKLFGTIAYPYMNGSLHAGHAFTISKVEFATGYGRMTGRRTLFPFGFHCTGMAIKACADKLVREIEMFGQDFEGYNEEEEVAKDAQPTMATGSAIMSAPAPKKEDPTKFTSKKSKVAAKSVKAKYQFQIMLAQGIPREEIHRFADAYHWVHVFPEAGRRHLEAIGLRVDWRRSFVTTDANPYYDSFVRWQMNKLKELGKIKFGKRYTIYSPKDGQACLDHDRSEGEGVNPQEYTAIKLKVLQWADAAKSAVDSVVPAGSQVYLVAATLRPETMYGQTCCFVSPKISYGIFKVQDGTYYFMTERAARNMAFQAVFPEWGSWEKMGEVQGSSIIGSLVNAPLSVYKDGVRILPMETIKATKGTGVVTCVPSDSPDDYVTVMDLAKKADYYGIKKEWASLEIVPIIETPTYGNLIAPTLAQQMKINSPKDAKQLAEAKEIAYRDGFYQGKMIIGECKGASVQEAKDIIRNKLIGSGDAFLYAEPEGFVLSRSGDECVVAHLDQWYLNYGNNDNGGDQEWCDQVLSHVNGELNTFSPESKAQFTRTLAWLGQWACARSYGLGSKLPWDHNFLVESLSDSTIYMSYYTVAHLLHKDIYGQEQGLAGVSVEQMTDDVWDYIFARTDKIPSGVPKETLQRMRREFEYWYPLDLRISGKDLVPNHLTFFLYVHTAIWGQQPEYWPRGIRPNGHLLLNGEKMSKSTGNFLTLNEAVQKYGADATRVAIADAGDGIEDANLEETVANKVILKLYELRKWCEEMMSEAQLVKDVEGYVQARDAGKTKNIDCIHRTGEKNFWDHAFENEMKALVAETKAAYDQMHYKDALKSGFYDFTNARDFYREATKVAGFGMHHDLVRQYIEVQALLLTPVAPHWAEQIWLEVLKKEDTVQNAQFPKLGDADVGAIAALEYARSTMTNITSAESAQQKKLAKGKAIALDLKKPKKITIYHAAAFPAWQDKYIEVMRASFEKLGVVDTAAVSKELPKAEMKKAMPFIQALKKRIDTGESSTAVFDRKLPFDELKVLSDLLPNLKRAVNKCQEVEIVTIDEGGATGTVRGGGPIEGLPPVAAQAVPGAPTFHFENVEA